MTCIRSFIHNIFSNFCFVFQQWLNRGTCHEASHVFIAGFPVTYFFRLMVNICILMVTHTWHAFSQRVLTQPSRRIFFMKRAYRNWVPRRRKTVLTKTKFGNLSCIATHLKRKSAGIVDTGGKFATGVNNTSGTGNKICRRCRWYWQQFCHRCHWQLRCTLTCEYLCEFSKNLKLPYGYF